MTGRPSRTAHSSPPETNPFVLEQLALQVKRSECATGEPLLVPEMTADEVRRNGVLPEVTGPPGSVRLSEPVRVPPAWVPVTALASALALSPSSTMVNAPFKLVVMSRSYAPGAVTLKLIE